MPSSNFLTITEIGWVIHRVKIKLQKIESGKIVNSLYESQHSSKIITSSFDDPENVVIIAIDFYTM